MVVHGARPESVIDVGEDLLRRLAPEVLGALTPLGSPVSSLPATVGASSFLAAGLPFLPRLARLDGASKVAAMSVAERSPSRRAEAPSTETLSPSAPPESSAKNTSVGRCTGVSFWDSGMRACRPRPSPRFF